MSVIEEVCIVTAKGQTTVPKAIRQALGVSYGGRITFRVDDGAVSVHAAGEPQEDPALAPFLALLERDIAARPEGRWCTLKMEVEMPLSPNATR
jgi:antitoxin PrlF